MRLLILSLLLLCWVTGWTQSTNSGGFGSNSGRMIPMAKLPPSQANDDVQARFLQQEWSPATVLFRNSPDQWRVPILFDVYSNKLYFKQDNQIMEFLDSVREFTITLGNSGDSSRITFRSFYPPIEENTAETFYQVIVDGSFQLLKCKAKTIYLHKEQDTPEEQRRYEKQLLYGYFPGKQMIALKKDKEQFLGQVPQEYVSMVQQILESKKLKLRNEESWRQLFSYLNE